MGSTRGPQVFGCSFTSTFHFRLPQLPQNTTAKMREARYANAAKNHNEKRATGNEETITSITAEVCPSAFAALAMLGLVFGGCCSNVSAAINLVESFPNKRLIIRLQVYALESIIK